MIPLRYATASQEITLGVFIDDTNQAPETGLTIANTDILLAKTGATTLASKNSGGATHISDAIYSAVLDATDTDTLGPMTIYVHPSGVWPVKIETVVYPADVYDALILGTDNIATDITATGVASILNELLAGYNIAGSLGKQVREITTSILGSGTSPDTGGTANTAVRIEFDSSASSTDGTYDPAQVLITGGTGQGQTRQVYEYDGTNKYAYVNRSWKVIPDSTSEYVIKGDAGDTHVNEGYARGGTANTITLNPLASSNNDTYVGQILFISAGTGEDQARIVTGYNGSTKVATVNKDWETIPVNEQSIYAMLPMEAPLNGIVKGTALANFQFLMVDNTDNVTPKTGLSITATISKDGAGFAATTNGASEVANGLYKITLTATEMSADTIVLVFTAAGANQRTITLFPK
jgi:hypothetical protein